MKRLGLALLSFAFAASVEASSAATVEGVGFVDTIQSGTELLTLRGTGIASRFRFVKIGAAALYVEEGVPADEALSDVGKSLVMESFRNIDGHAFIDRVEEALQANVPASRLKQLRPRIDKLHEAYEPLHPGDRYVLSYDRESGTRLELNGVSKVTIEGADFAAAYFAVWLGDRPLSEKLKSRLLGEGR